MSTTGQPCTAADITPSWVLDVATALRRDSQAHRPSECGLKIEVQSINTGAWFALALPTLSGRFGDRATRDATLACIEAELKTGTMARDRASALQNDKIRDAGERAAPPL